jgi:hypothetical protein
VQAQAAGGAGLPAAAARSTEQRQLGAASAAGMLQQEQHALGRVPFLVDSLECAMGHEEAAEEAAEAAAAADTEADDPAKEGDAAGPSSAAAAAAADEAGVTDGAAAGPSSATAAAAADEERLACLLCAPPPAPPVLPVLPPLMGNTVRDWQQRCEKLAALPSMQEQQQLWAEEAVAMGSQLSQLAMTPSSQDVAIGWLFTGPKRPGKPKMLPPESLELLSAVRPLGCLPACLPASGCLPACQRASQAQRTSAQPRLNAASDGLPLRRCPLPLLTCTSPFLPLACR